MMFKYSLFLAFIVGVLSSIPSFASAGTISNSFKYAWSDRSGYVNFANVLVSNSSLSGYAWSENGGFINLNPATGGVSNSNGNLSGYAWGESLGWINFDNVSINTSTGRFSGTATGTLVGTINFDCPNYCDVRTDWRPAAVAGNFGGGGSSSGASSNSISVSGDTLSLSPSQSGRLTESVSDGQVTITVPSGASKDGLVVSVQEESSNKLSVSQFRVVGAEFSGGVIYEISATDLNGNSVHKFSDYLTITLPIPSSIKDKSNLMVFWLNEAQNKWIPITNFFLSGSMIGFQVDHLTRFAIFSVDKPELFLGEKSQASISDSLGFALPAEQKQITGGKEIDILSKDQLKGMLMGGSPNVKTVPVNDPFRNPIEEKEGVFLSSSTPNGVSLEKNNAKIWSILVLGICALLLSYFAKKKRN